MTPVTADGRGLGAPSRCLAGRVSSLGFAGPRHHHRRAPSSPRCGRPPASRCCGCWSGRPRPLSIDTALMFGAMLAFGAAVRASRSGRRSRCRRPHCCRRSSSSSLLRRSLPGLGGARTRALDSPRRAGRLPRLHHGRRPRSAPSSASAVVAGWPAGPRPGARLLLWIGRNICGILLVTTAGLLLFQYLAQPRPRPRLWEGSTLEFVAACLTSVRCTSRVRPRHARRCSSWSSAC